MATKTYYPSFKRLVHVLAVFLANHQAVMIQRLAISGTSFEADLIALNAALVQIEAHWQPYVEPQ